MQNGRRDHAINLAKDHAFRMRDMREHLAQGKHDGTLGFPGHTKERQGKKQRFKKKEEKATKEKEKDNCLDLASVQLGDRHFARTRTVARQSGPTVCNGAEFLKCPTRTSKAGRQ